MHMDVRWSSNAALRREAAFRSDAPAMAEGVAKTLWRPQYDCMEFS